MTGVFSKHDFAGLPKHIKKHLLHRVGSFNLDNYVRLAATQMGDTNPLAKLSEGDMVAREVCYHENFMTFQE